MTQDFSMSVAAHDDLDSAFADTPCDHGSWQRYPAPVPDLPRRRRANNRALVVAGIESLMDVHFRQVATRRILPAVYLMGVGAAVGLPLAIGVLIFNYSVMWGLVYVPCVPFIVLAGVATIRVFLEFLLMLSLIGQNMTHMLKIADGLHNTLEDVVSPVNTMAAGVRAVTFWKPQKQASRSRARR